MFIHTVAICLATTLHGAPTTICRTSAVPTPTYATANQCEATTAHWFAFWYDELTLTLRLHADDTVWALPCSTAKQ